MTQHIKFVHEKVEKVKERVAESQQSLFRNLKSGPIINILATKSETVLLGPEMSKQL